MTRPVYIAGMALVCAAGITPTAQVQRFAAGRIDCSTITVGDECFPYYRLPLSEIDWLLRAQQAVKTLAAQLPALHPDLALFFASSSFQLGLLETQTGELPPAVAAFSNEVAHWLGCEGPRTNFNNACISGFSALETAKLLIAEGVLDEALVVGCELANVSTVAGFAALQLLSPTACRPFDARRDGLVLGEALAAVHLSATPAPWCLSAVHTGFDGSSPTSLDPSGEPLLKLLHACLEAAGLRPEDIDLVKLQAAGSPTTDLAEAVALRQLFAIPPPLVSFKSWLGHTLGASGIAELVALLRLLEDGRIPVTPGFAVPDPEIGLCPAAPADGASVQHALLDLVGFGGGIAGLVLSRT